MPPSEPKRVLRLIDHIETDEYGYEIIVLAPCGHRFMSHQTGGKPTAKRHRRLQWCEECSKAYVPPA